MIKTEKLERETKSKSKRKSRSILLESSISFVAAIVLVTASSLTSGALLFRDLKTISTLGSASVAQAAMSARGYTPEQIKTFLQPILIDLHQPSNPWTNYNVYLSTVLVPGMIMLFAFLITAYSLGTELKFCRSKHWLALSGNNMPVAMAGKVIPQTIVFLAVTYGYMYYVYGILDFPHPGGMVPIVISGLLMVLASQPNKRSADIKR